MKLKLIQAGGFAGRKKMAEEDLDDHPDQLKEQVKEVFSQPLKALPRSKERDKEQHFLEFEGKVVPVQSFKPSKEFKSLIKKMQSNLDY